ncbi:MAG: fibronectin type III domain-containing protein, partial [Candidatus Nanopelagicales bacterium]
QLDNAPTLSTDQPGQITVTVDPDTSGNGGTPSDYVVTLFDSNGDEAGTCEVVVGTSPLACTITGPEGGLDVDEEYTATVTPRNGAGLADQASPPSAPGYANVAPNAPGTPTARVAEGDNAVAITVPPSTEGGAATSYVVEALVDGDPLSPPVTCPIPNPAESMTCVITGLIPGTNYTFRSRGVNSAGDGAWSEPSNVIGSGLPSKPGVPSANVLEPGVIRVTVDPSVGGGTPDGYRVTAQPGGATCEVAANAVPLVCNVEGLSTAESYTFTVIAFNEAGNSVPSNPSNQELANRAPGTPGLPVPDVTGDGEVTITVPPSTEGGAATSYTVRALVDGEPVDPARECTITGSPLPQPLSCEITGLTPGVNYAFEARGENNAGDGGWSTDSVEVNPAGQPGQPGERQPVVDEPGTLDVTVVPPTTGGTPTDYVVNILNADNDVVDTCTLPFNADPLECGFTGLNPEEQYTVEVIAENGAGDSRRTVGPLYPNQLPDSPTAPHAVVSGDGEVTVTVTPTTGGGASTKYIVEALNAEGDPLSPSVVCVIDENPLPNPLTCVFDDLDSNLEYTFRVKGESSRGEGSWSPASNVVTPDGAPGSPTQAPEVVADEPGVVTVTVDPVTDGGTPDEYVVTAEPGGATCIISASANPLSCQISGLNPDESYTFSYDARNDAGTSENASPASEPIAPNTPPEQPPAPRAVVTDDGEVTVTVEPSAGGSDASSFTVQAYEDGVPVDGASCTVDAGDDPLSCVIEGLDPNTSYEFQAQGENSAGTSPMSDSSEPVIPGAPSTPNRPSVTPTAPGVVEVAVDPASGGGTPTDFTVVIRNEEGNIVPGATCTVQATADPLSCEITGLDPNQEYTAETIANNGAGPSNPSQPSPDFAPNIVPSAPGTPSAQGTGAGEVTVTVPPSTTGGTPTSYVVEALVDGSPLAPPVVCTISGNPLPASLTCVFDELSADTEYTFRAVAENSAGQSPSSAPSNAVTPDGIPGVPGQPSVVVTDSGEVTVTVDPPSTGGQVEQYTVRALDSNGNPVSGKTCTVNPDDDPLSCEIAGLNPNSRYTFEVVAENDFGASDASEPSAPVRPGPPSAPKRPTVTVPEPGTVEVTVDPANGGGTPTDYAITGIDEDGQPIFDPDGNPVACTIPANADPLSCQFTGLDPNTPVRFVSDAENGAGSSPNSAPSNPTVPNVVPGQPGTPTVEVDDEGVVTINIQPPSTGGVPDSYTVTAYPGGASCTIPATKVPLACQIEGLNPETDYVFTTVAENSAGSSAPSAPSNNAVPGGPAQPLAPQATPDGRGKAKIKVLPNGDGGTANEFIIRAVDQDGNVVPGATCTVSGSADPLECVISGLDPFEPYTFESRAQNGIGNTDWSARSAPIVPNVVPGAPAKPKVEVSGEGRATVTVTPAATGGLPGKYVIISEPDGKSCEILLGQTSCVVEGLDPSKSYSFKAIAENDEGNSESVPSDPVVPTRPSKPSAPTVAPGGDKQVVVTIPKNSSGGTPSRYEVTAQPGGAKCVVSADANPLRCVFSNLNPNQQYRFAVKAVNGAGDSVSSALSAAVNPGGKRVSKPNKVRDMKTSGKSTSAKRVVTWKRPTGINAKRPLNGYLLTVQVQGIPKILISKKLAAKTTKYTLTQKQLLNAATKMRGEANSLRFVIRLVAFNDAGSSPVSVNRITVKKPKSSSGKATATKPNKVRTISVSGKETSSKRVVSWTKPQGVTSKVPLTGYAVVVKLKDNKTAVIKKSLTAKTTELTLTTKELASALKQAGIKFDKKKVLDFLVEIRAINSVGKSGAVAKDVLVKLK